MSSYRTELIQEELEELRSPKNAHKDGVRLVRAIDDSHWRVEIDGLPGTIWEGGVWELDVRLPAEYPSRYPDMKFITPIYHPSISTTGLISSFSSGCHIQGILDSYWCLRDFWDRDRPLRWIRITVRSVLLLLQEALDHPNADSPMNGEAANLYRSDRAAYERKVREWISKHCKVRTTSKAGQVLVWERFEPVGTIPKGGQSLEVIKLRDKETGAIVVAKIISARQIDTQRLQREVDLLWQFRDVPQIVRFLGISWPSSSQGDVAILTKFAEGGSLSSALENKELGGEQMSSIMIDVLLGLQTLHSAEVVHRDIKPSNILLNLAKNHAFLCDLGASRLVEEGVTQTLTLTQAYAAEEALAGRAVLASDIFSFGVVLREAVTGCRITERDQPWLAVRDGRFDVRNVGNPVVRALILDCVQRDPAARPPVAAVLDRLRLVGSSLLASAPEETRRIRFREGEDPTICSFVAKISDNVGQALEKARLVDGRLYLGDDPVPLRMRVDGLDSNVVYVFR